MKKINKIFSRILISWIIIGVFVGSQYYVFTRNSHDYLFPEEAYFLYYYIVPVWIITFLVLIVVKLVLFFLGLWVRKVQRKQDGRYERMYSEMKEKQNGIQNETNSNDKEQ